MKTRSILFLVLLFVSASAFAQTNEYPIETIFSSGKSKSSGGYGAITNKFTTIDGRTANIVEVYGGWYINHRFLLGFAAAGVTNDIPVLPEFSADPSKSLSYEYGHVGLMTEYVLFSERKVHVAFQLFTGAGFTTQYERHNPNQDFENNIHSETYDNDWLFVTEPGVSLEMNVFKWMRFSPGVSYRAAFNSNAKGLSENSLSAMSYNLTLKFGKF